MRLPTSVLLGLLIASLVPEAAARTFTGTNGKKIVAEIKSATETSVELETENGKIYNVALKNLREDDQFHIAVWREEQDKSKALRGVEISTVMEANEWPGVDIRMAAGLPAIDLEINGQQTTFVINTTLGRNLLLESAAQAASLDPKLPEGAQAPKGVVGVATVNMIGVGGEEISQKLEFLVVTPEAMNEKIRQEAAGFLGFPFLQQSGAVIDWAARKLWFPDAKPATDEEEDKEEDKEEDEDEDDKDEDDEEEDDE